MRPKQGRTAYTNADSSRNHKMQNKERKAESLW